MQPGKHLKSQFPEVAGSMTHSRSRKQVPNRIWCHQTLISNTCQQEGLQPSRARYLGLLVLLSLWLHPPQVCPAAVTRQCPPHPAWNHLSPSLPVALGLLSDQGFFPWAQYRYSLATQPLPGCSRCRGPRCHQSSQEKTRPTLMPS